MERIMESKPIHLKIKSHPKNLNRIRSVMADVLSTSQLSKKNCDSIILAVDEACSNIIKHSYKNDHTRSIDLTIELKTDSLTILIVDDGIKFDINSVKTRDICDIRPGGLGIYIIKQVMDIVTCSLTPEGFNKLKMVKKLND